MGARGREFSTVLELGRHLRSAECQWRLPQLRARGLELLIIGVRRGVIGNG